MAANRVAPLSAPSPVGQNERDCAASSEAHAKTANLIVVENAVATRGRLQRFDRSFGDSQTHDNPFRVHTVSTKIAISVALIVSDNQQVVNE
jgi:hypothetical protein